MFPRLTHSGAEDEVSNYKASFFGDPHIASSEESEETESSCGSSAMESQVSTVSDNLSVREEYMRSFQYGASSTSLLNSQDFSRSEETPDHHISHLAKTLHAERKPKTLSETPEKDERKRIRSNTVHGTRKQGIAVTSSPPKRKPEMNEGFFRKKDVSQGSESTQFLPPPHPKNILHTVGSMDKTLREIIGDGTSQLDRMESQKRLYEAMQFCQNKYEHELHVNDPSPLLAAFAPFTPTQTQAQLHSGDVMPKFDLSLLNTSETGNTTETRIKRPSFLKNHQLLPPSKSLMPHQKIGIRWLVSLYANGLSGVLADEMGLGKSIQTAVFLNIIRIIYNTTGKHLIICPTSMIHEWKQVLANWCRTLSKISDCGCCEVEDAQCVCPCHGTFRTITITELLSQVPDAANNERTVQKKVDQSTLISNGAKAAREILKNTDILIVNYDFLKLRLRPKTSDVSSSYSVVKLETMHSYSIRRLILHAHYSYVVCDEGHRIFNQESVTSKRIFHISSDFRLVLTGTPLQNKLSELSSLVKYILIGHGKEYSSSQLYVKDSGNDTAPLKAFFTDISLAQEVPAARKNVNANLETLAIRLHQLLRPFILRRERQDILPLQQSRSITSTIESKSTVESSSANLQKNHFSTQILVRCPISSVQKSLLDKKNLPIEFRQSRFSNDPTGLEDSSSMIKCNHFKKISMHPYLLLREFIVNENLIASSGKLTVLDELVRKLLTRPESEQDSYEPVDAGPPSVSSVSLPSSHHLYHRKILIFCHYHAMLDILEDWSRLRRYPFLRLDGSTNQEDRVKIIKQFTSDFTIPILFLTKKAGGLGLNLQVADTVILYEMGSNYGLDAQAISRICRISQKKRIKIIQLICGAGLEDQTQELSNTRRKTSEMFLDQEQLSHHKSLEERANKLFVQANRSHSGNDHVDSPQLLSEVKQVSPQSLGWNEAIARTDAELTLFDELDKRSKKIDPSTNSSGMQKLKVKLGKR